MGVITSAAAAAAVFFPSLASASSSSELCRLAAGVEVPHSNVRVVSRGARSLSLSRSFVVPPSKCSMEATSDPRSEKNGIATGHVPRGVKFINGSSSPLKESSAGEASTVELTTTCPWVPEDPLCNEPASNYAEKQGLGIKQFLKNKKILITGATGFLAKVLVEKILRAQPDVGQLYLLINAKATPIANERLVKEIQWSRLFEVLKDRHGDKYEEFIGTKLTAVGGNVGRSDLGMERDTAEALMKDVDIIVNSAATTNFIERYDVALDINTKGPLHLLEFAKKCQKLKLFLHVSTAYVNGKRVGRALEKPFRMDESIARESLGDHSAPPLNVQAEIKSVQQNPDELKDLAAKSKDEIAQQAQNMKELGLKRAALHGWQDTYVFTKAMGEMLVTENRGDVPVVIVRPTVVEGTFAQPFSGWMEGIRMMDPILLTYGRGQTSSFYVDPNGVLDVVPADMVVNSILAAMAKHAGEGPCLNVYHVGSSVVNPLTFQKLANYTYEHFRSQPFMDQKGNPVLIPKMTFITNRYSLFLYHYLQFRLPVLISRLFPWTQREDTQRRLKYIAYASQRVKQLIDTYAAYTFYKGRFDISNIETLYKELSAEEQEEFGFAVWSIEWDTYIKNIHLPGLRKYTLEGNTAFRI